MRKPIHSGRAIEITSCQLDVCILTLWKARIDRNPCVMRRSNVCFDGCQFPFLECNTVARFQRLRAGRLIKFVNNRYAKIPIDLRTSSMFLEEVMRMEKLVGLENPSNDDFLPNDFVKEFTLHRDIQTPRTISSQWSTPREVPCQPSWPSNGPSLPRPSTCQDCISPAR